MNNRINKLEIVVFDDNGPVQTFYSIQDASNFLQADRHTVVRRIMDGGEISHQYTVDWGLHSDNATIKDIEATYTRRFETIKQNSKEYYAAQKKM